MQENDQEVRVWDLPTRLFHWLLALAVTAMVVTGKIGGNLMDWHGRIGLVVAALVAFRIVWGLCGSTHARFASFFPTPGRIRAYLRGEWRGLGHNPLGALSVLGMLGLLLLQIGTGLIGNDDIAFRGPLFNLVDKALSDRATGVHKLLAYALFAMIALHVAAIMFYAHVKQDNLLRPMITGRKTATHGAHASGGGVLALIVAALIATAAAYGASGAWLPPPPVPAAAETPAW